MSRKYNQGSKLEALINLIQSPGYKVLEEELEKRIKALEHKAIGYTRDNKFQEAKDKVSKRDEVITILNLVSSKIEELKKKREEI